MSEEAIENKLGTKITTLREAHHLTQQDLADRCQCDIETIQGLENGELPPSLAPLIKITRALGVRLGTLMDDDEARGATLHLAGADEGGHAPQEPRDE